MNEPALESPGGQIPDFLANAALADHHGEVSDMFFSGCAVVLHL